MLHASGARHAGHPITSGERWVLVVFVLARTVPQLARRCGERAVEQRRAGWLDAARADFEAGLAVAPSDHELLHGLASVMAMQGDAEVACRRRLWQASQLYSPCPKPRNALAAMLLHAGRTRAALRWFESALARAAEVRSSAGVAPRAPHTFTRARTLHQGPHLHEARTLHPGPWTLHPGPSRQQLRSSTSLTHVTAHGTCQCRWTMMMGGTRPSTRPCAQFSSQNRKPSAPKLSVLHQHPTPPHPCLSLPPPPPLAPPLPPQAPPPLPPLSGGEHGSHTSGEHGCSSGARLRVSRRIGGCSLYSLASTRLMARLPWCPRTSAESCGTQRRANACGPAPLFSAPGMTTTASGLYRRSHQGSTRQAARC